MLSRPRCPCCANVLWMPSCFRCLTYFFDYMIDCDFSFTDCSWFLNFPKYIVAWLTAPFWPVLVIHGLLLPDFNINLFSDILHLRLPLQIPGHMSFSPSLLLNLNLDDSLINFFNNPLPPLSPYLQLEVSTENNLQPHLSDISPPNNLLQKKFHKDSQISPEHLPKNMAFIPSPSHSLLDDPIVMPEPQERTLTTTEDTLFKDSHCSNLLASNLKYSGEDDITATFFVQQLERVL